MAAVYLAELDGASGFSKQVALKVIHRHLMADASFTRMFMDEARIAARLHHPNIVQTFDLVHNTDYLAIAMEYAPGFPASSLLPDSARRLDLHVEPELVAYVGAEAAAGLHHAHTLTDTHGEELGIVHRDISLANVHIGFDGRVRVVDFGIARARGRLSTTGQGLVKGTFSYVAPEQFSGAEPTPQSDVWSLGVVLWELLAGRRLFRRETEADTARAVLSAAIPGIETLRSDFPLALGIAIHRALERDPARRWPSAKDLEERLREVLPAKIETVREPLLRALAPHRDAHFDELRSLLEVGDTEASSAPELSEVDADSGEAVVRDGAEAPSAEERQGRQPDETPMSAANLPTLPRPRRRVALLAGGAAAIALAVVVALGLGGLGGGADGPTHRGRRGVPQPSESADQAETPPPVPEPEPAQVALEVTSAVPGARVLLDGVRLGEAPVRTLVPRDAGEHVIRVEADGRVAVERRAPLDQPLQLALDPTTPASVQSGERPRPQRRWRKNLTFDTNVYR